MKIHDIELDFQGQLFAISSFLIETSDGPILVESGPYSTVKSLEKGIEQCGYKSTDIKHVLLTHIHLDHAGAAWHFAEQGAQIYLHPQGYKHMHDPSKLLASAKMIYGDMMEQLWGTLKPIPANQLSIMEDGDELQIGEYTFKAIYSPGHAKHHIAWQLDNILFTGDVAGICIKNGPVVPPCPPPDINIEDWLASIQKILAIKEIDTYYLTHGGIAQNCASHMEKLQQMLEAYSSFMLPYYKAGSSIQEVVQPFNDFVKELLLKNGTTQNDLNTYESANPSFMAVAGLLRYWKKKYAS